ncbi:MAG: DUF4183 domain-containing protein [Tissierellia bacterium]|nr:DUF4183 domain-containing protein [Tissierellia bacterium]
MAVKLFKLVVEATTTTDVQANPVVNLYFYEVNDAHRVDNDLQIPANAFSDPNGDPATTLEPVADGYHALYINGVQQQDVLFEVVNDGDQLNILGVANEILTGTPIVYVVTNFEPIATSDTTIAT